MRNPESKNLISKDNSLIAKDNAAYFRAVVETTNEAIITINSRGLITFWNKAAESIFGYSAAEIINRPLTTLMPTRFREEAQTGLERVAAGGEPHIIGQTIEVVGLKKDGSEFPLELSLAIGQAGGETFFTGVARDIAKRKQAEEELRRRNRELTLLNQIITASATVLEPEVLLDMACRELALACQIPRATATLLSKTGRRATVMAEYGPEDLWPGLNKSFPVKDNPIVQRLLTHKRSLVVADAPNDPRLAPLHEIIRQRGTASLLIVPLVIEDKVIGSLNLESDEPRHFSVETIDLVWRAADQVAGTLARLQLGEEQRLLNAVIEQTAESVIITDTAGDIIYINSALEQTSGYSRAEVTGQNPRLLKSGRQDDAFYKELWETLIAGRVWQGRFINKKKNGELYTEEAVITPVRDDNGDITSYVAVKRDITHELLLEEQFRQAQKMESIGRLAGGVAHDFNNILTAILGHSELLLAHFLKLDDPRRKEIEQIEKAARRASRLTRQLLAFSRRQRSEPRVLNLNDIIADIEKLLNHLLGDDITLSIHLAPDLGRVKTDPGQVEQILMNLAVNARDAMPRGGKLTFKTTNIDLDSDYTGQHFEVKPGPYVMLSVTDTGIGMDAEIQAHIFEPFFTTKKIGQGTGLGLSTVHGIVRQSGGHIQVYSEPGRGATFKIYLPRTTDAPTLPPAPQPAPESLAGTETILVVEDNPGVRLVIGKSLRKQGYTILEANHAEAGLQQYKQYEGQIDLLITDVIMPGMSGPELADQLAQLKSNLKVIFTSGYADDQLDRRGLSIQNAAFLEKPFSLEALARAVREVLNAG